MIVKTPDEGREGNRMEQMDLSHLFFWWRQSTYSNSKTRVNQMQSKETDFMTADTAETKTRSSLERQVDVQAA